MIRPETRFNNLHDVAVQLEREGVDPIIKGSDELIDALEAKTGELRAR